MIMSKERKAPAPRSPRLGSVLIIDHDTELCRTLGEYLKREGFEVTSAPSATQGLEAARSGDHSLVLLDVVLRGASGLDVLRQIRSESDIPVIVLTERGDDVDRIIGLELGADDYLPKPFNQRELVARIRAILRRSTRGASPAPVQPTVLQLGDLEMDLARRQTTLGGKTVTLTGLEFELLRVFLGAAGQVVSRQDIAREVFHRPMLAMDRTLSVHVCSLRRKLGDAPRGGERIKTVHGVGYIYLPPSDPFDGAM
jgi:two-component system response regulator CpxR